MERKRITELIARHTPSPGESQTPFEGVTLFRVEEPIGRLPGVLPPSVCVVVQGMKRAYCAGAVHDYDENRYLCSTMPLPIDGEAPAASREKPILGVLVSLESRAMVETLLAYETQSAGDRKPNRPPAEPGLGVAHWDARFSESLLRLLELLDTPNEAAVLGGGRLKEFLYSVIRGDAGPVIRRSLGTSRDISRAVRYIQEHLGEAVAVQELADLLGMSRPVFDRQFRAATTYSPLQFIKAYRLNSAAMLIVNGARISQAADQVGYASLSQFSREFERQFGASPRAWLRSLEAHIEWDG